MTARANTAYTERTDLSGNRLATATIAWASTWVPSTTCRSSSPAGPVSAMKRFSPIRLHVEQVEQSLNGPRRLR